MPSPLVIAVPKGRILAELLPILARVGIEPEPAFADEGSRALSFSTSRAGVSLIRVRAFDVATIVAHGGAALGVVGSDVLAEFAYPELYAPVDLGIGRCRLSVAMPADAAARGADTGGGPIRVATKYPALARRHYEAKGIVAEPIKLNGAMELAPTLGLADRIVDLVSTGRTLAENGLVEVETVTQVSARLIAGRVAFKTQGEVAELVDAFRAAA